MKRTNEQYEVWHNGERVYMLNNRLAEAQNVTDDELATIVKLHQLKLEVFDKMEATDDPAELKAFAGRVTEIEFEMQKNWHFPQDATYHDWFLVPKCKCPKMDNRERKGTKYMITVQNCPIHGVQLVEVKE